MGCWVPGQRVECCGMWVTPLWRCCMLPTLPICPRHCRHVGLRRSTSPGELGRLDSWKILIRWISTSWSSWEGGQFIFTPPAHSPTYWKVFVTCLDVLEFLHGCISIWLPPWQSTPSGRLPCHPCLLESAHSAIYSRVPLTRYFIVPLVTIPFLYICLRILIL